LPRRLNRPLAPPFHALVPAAGSGSRFGAALPKQFFELGGRPVLSWTLSRLLAAGAVGVTVALPPAYLSEADTVLGVDPRLTWVEGGDSRQQSVEICLRAAGGGEDDLILVHDGARPAIAVADIQATVRAAATGGAAILGRPMGDTVKRVEVGRVVGTVDRSALFRAETPQVFRRRILVEALKSARADRFRGTDEASLVERLRGVSIAVVAATSPNPKLTEAGDWETLEALLRSEV